MEQRLLFKHLSELVKQGQSDAALAKLRDALRRGDIDIAGREKAGRFIANTRANNATIPTDATVTLLGQMTTSWLAHSLVAEGWERGLSLEVVEGQYDNVMQELMTRVPDSVHPHLVVLAPWAKRLLSNSDSIENAISQELEFWRQAWDLAAQRLQARLIQISYDWIVPGALGFHLSAGPKGDVHLIRQVNDAIRQQLPTGSYFVDLEEVSGTMGRDLFYDQRRYHWTKQPFSEAGAGWLAKHICAGIRALLRGPKKVLVVDLDNTLWGGIVGEVGPAGLTLGEGPDGEAFSAFQKHIKALTQRGVLLTACSKNNPEDALAPFEKNSEMVLKKDDFAHIEASWKPKEIGLRHTAETLNLGLDSFVFFDDNPAEREHIRQALPEVEVVEVPEDPANYVRALQAGLWFESVAISSDDTHRARQYQEEHQRRESQKAFASLDEYLRSLEMRATVRPIDDSSMQRVSQLIAKTNQFNLTSRRHGIADVNRMLQLPDAVGLTMNIVDRFGDHGLVSVMIGIPDRLSPRKTLLIDTWLMSCRVIGRTAEHYLFNAFLDHAIHLGYQYIKGEFVPSAKNSLVADLYKELGFSQSDLQAEDVVSYQLPVSPDRRVTTFIQSAE